MNCLLMNKFTSISGVSMMIARSAISDGWATYHSHTQASLSLRYVICRQGFLFYYDQHFFMLEQIVNKYKAGWSRGTLQTLDWR